MSNKSMKPEGELKKIVEKFELQPHPEGGFYKEIYRSEESVQIPPCVEPRSIATSIYYLLDGNNFSAFHRFKSDEIWHYYRGHSINIYILNEVTKGVDILRLGDPIIDELAVPQIMVPKNKWFAASIVNTNPQAYTFVGCTVAPGFDFKDFELASRATLVEQFPNAKSDIVRHTK